MEFEIKKGIPLPKTRGKPRKYNIELDKLDVDDMVEISLSKVNIPTEVKIIRNFVLRYVHKNPTKKFTVRQTDKGVGIWRIK
tara:strand:+ start:3020 stop:3265 length:246 start_codon:yes stop_codon:yes gene_type:complete